MLKRGLAIGLTVLLILSAVFPASAEDAPRPVYVALGDSITAGFGLPFYDYETYLQLEQHTQNYPDDCYVKAVGDALGADTYNLSVPGFDTSALLYTLQGIDIVNDPSCDYWIRPCLEDCLPQGYSYVDLFLGDTPSAEALRRADYITLNVGGNNLLSVLTKSVLDLRGVDGEALFRAMFRLSAGGHLDTMVTDTLKVMVDAFSAEDLTPADLLALLQSVLPMLDANYTKKMIDGAIASIKRDYEQILTLLRQINPTAQICVVSFYNYYAMKADQIPSTITAFRQTLNRLTASYDRMVKGEITPLEWLQNADGPDLGNLVYTLAALAMNRDGDRMMTELNDFLRQITAGKDGIAYTDITGIPYTPKMDPHPAAQGHAYMAERINASFRGAVNCHIVGGIASVYVDQHLYAAQNAPAILPDTCATLSVRPASGYRVVSVQADGKTLTPDPSGQYVLTGALGGVDVTVTLQRRAATMVKSPVSIPPTACLQQPTTAAVSRAAVPFAPVPVTRVSATPVNRVSTTPALFLGGHSVRLVSPLRDFSATPARWSVFQYKTSLRALS